jgi:hypothetical protein
VVATDILRTPLRRIIELTVCIVDLGCTRKLYEKGMTLNLFTMCRWYESGCYYPAMAIPTVGIFYFSQRPEKVLKKEEANFYLNGAKK